MTAYDGTFLPPQYITEPEPASLEGIPCDECGEDSVAGWVLAGSYFHLQCAAVPAAMVLADEEKDMKKREQATEILEALIRCFGVGGTIGGKR